MDDCDDGLRAALRSYDDGLRLLTAPFASEVAPDAAATSQQHPVDPWHGDSIKDSRGLLMNATLLNGALAVGFEHTRSVDPVCCTLFSLKGFFPCNSPCAFDATHLDSTIRYHSLRFDHSIPFT
jgi:hypothetical protein